MTEPKWKTETRFYEITEISKNGREVYHMKMTGKEVMDWCKMKREAYGYIAGIGGDKKYDCFAIDMADWIR